MSVAPAVSTISRPETAGVPYITAAEFQNSSTGLQLSNLIPSNPAPQQAQALQVNILRASSWMDAQCHQVLASTTDTEMAKLRIKRSGAFTVFTRCFPIRAVTAVSTGWFPEGLTAMTSLTGVAIQNRSFTVYPGSLPFSTNQGPIQFGPTRGQDESWVQYSYVNGYPVTTLSANCASAASQITLVNPLGVIPGMVLTLSDIPSTETVGVLSVSGSVVTLTGTTAHAHNSGVAVTALPDVIKQACILATSGFIQERGTGALTMATINGTPTHVNAPSGGPSVLQQALAILEEGEYVARVSLPSQQ